MFKRLLIVLEPGGAEACVPPWMLSMAQACDGELVFFTCMSTASPVASDLLEIELSTRWDSFDEMRSGVERMHEEARLQAGQFGIRTSSMISHATHTVAGILAAAAASGCDLIVVCNRTGNTLVRWLSGNVIPGLVSSSPWPILVCPRGLPAEETPSARRPRVSIVVEGGDPSPLAFGHGLEIAGDLGAEVLLVHIKPCVTVLWLEVEAMVGSTSDRLEDAIQEQSRHMLAASVALVERAGLRAETVSLPSSTSGRDVARLAAGQGCDLIVSTQRRGNAVMRFINGNLTAGLISAAKKPVLIFPGSEPAASDPSATLMPRSGSSVEAANAADRCERRRH